MAYKQKKNEWNPLSGWECEFICDTEADILYLPNCSAGSMAIVTTDGMPNYMVNASGEWVRVC